MKQLTDVMCVFRIQLMSMRTQAGPFFLAALVFPAAMYLFANAVGAQATSGRDRLRFLAGSIVFSLSLTSISWLGYLLLENRFTGSSQRKRAVHLACVQRSDAGVEK